MEYNGPWMTNTVTILIETNYGDTLNSLKEEINKHDFFEGVEIGLAMLMEQNPELLFQVVDEYDYIEPGTFLLLTANTPLWRIHSGGRGLTITM